MTSHVRAYRERAGLRPLELARQSGITRQALHSIETGAYVPNTQIALQLARLLKCSVEDLFTLHPPQISATLLGKQLGRVQLAQVGTQWLAFPLGGVTGLGESADGLTDPTPSTPDTTELHEKNTVLVSPLGDLTLPRRTAVVAGCDPALALLPAHLTKTMPDTRVLLRPESSLDALHTLARGEAHAAGIHLWDATTGQSNLPFVQRELPGRATHLFTLWSWEQGLMVQSGNPHGLQGVRDLLRPDIRLVNREEGAGSRVLLDAWLDKAKITRRARRAVTGYAHEVMSPMLAAQAVASGVADVAPGPKSAALACGLDFIPLQTERFDLVVPDEFLNHPGILALLNMVSQPAFRTELRSLGGYDPTHAGERWKTTA